MGRRRRGISVILGVIQWRKCMSTGSWMLIHSDLLDMQLLCIQMIATSVMKKRRLNALRRSSYMRTPLRGTRPAPIYIPFGAWEAYLKDFPDLPRFTEELTCFDD